MKRNAEKVMLVSVKQVAMNVISQTVHIELRTGDEYMAQVLYDDIKDRLQSGQKIAITLGKNG